MPIQKEIENLIYQKLPLFACNQKKIADFFLEHIDLVALLPIKDIAQKVGVSEASIVRFGQLLGYKGYKDLKQELSAVLKNQLSPTQRYHHAISEKEKIPDTLKLASDNVINNIHDTIQSLDKEVFTQIVDRIITAQRIYCLGLEISAHLSQLMTFLLRLYSYDAQYFSMDFFRYQEQIEYLNKNDLLIAFSFSPYSRETIEALALAKKRGIKSIAFTDKKTSPIRQFASYCIQIKTDNIMFSNSLGAVVTVINAIINELNFKDQRRTLHALQIIEESIKDERYFISPEK
jgi:DNA-binding MurR/RpiR family transcriptional regulator